MAEFDLDTQLRVQALGQANQLFTDAEHVLEAAEKFYGFLKGLDAKPERIAFIEEPNVTVYTPFGDGGSGAWLLEDETDRTVYRDEDGSFEVSCYDADELRSSEEKAPSLNTPVKAGRQYVEPTCFDTHGSW